MAVRGGAGRRRRRGGSRRLVRAPWRRATLEAVALVAAALIAAIALLGELARAVAGRGIWLHVVPFTGAVLGLGIAAALLLRAWLIARARLAGYASRAPVILALVVAALALLVSRRPAFRREMYELQALVGGSAEAERTSVSTSARCRATCSSLSLRTTSGRATEGSAPRCSSTGLATS